MAQNLMHIGKLAKEAGTTPRTVRFYEEMGLIQPECRTEGGFRCYSGDQLVRLRMILSLKEMEFELDQIKHILRKNEQHETGGKLAEAFLDDLRDRLKDTEAQITHYQIVHAKIAQAIQSLCECVNCHRKLQERSCPSCEELRKGRMKSVPFFHVQNAQPKSPSNS